jgi:hypothetical protein
VQGSQGLVKVPKKEKSSIVEENIGGRRSRSLGARDSKGFPEENKDLHEVVKRDFKSKPLDLEGHMEKDQQIVDSQSKEVESGEENTREVRTHEVITTVDRQRNEDHRSGNRERRRRKLTKFLNCGVVKGVDPRSQSWSLAEEPMCVGKIVLGHIRERV